MPTLLARAPCVRADEMIEWTNLRHKEGSMAAYFVIDLDIHDTVGFDEYVRVVSRVIEKYGGRYVVRREAVEVLEGEWKPKRLTVIEFPSKARARGSTTPRSFGRSSTSATGRPRRT